MNPTDRRESLAADWRRERLEKLKANSLLKDVFGKYAIEGPGRGKYAIEGE